MVKHKLMTAIAAGLLFAGCSHEYQHMALRFEAKPIGSEGSSADSSGTALDMRAIGKKLDELGDAGWEVVSSTSLTETKFPNFGNGEYHTGLKSNTRTSEIIVFLKREL